MLTPEVKQYQHKNVNVKFTSGDITRIPADILVKPVNSEQAWMGRMDASIMRTAGTGFHAGAARALNQAHAEGHDLQQNATIFVDGNNIPNGQRRFDSAIFVIDDLQAPLNEVVAAGVNAAFLKGIQTVSLPLMRAGVMAGVVEGSEEEVYRQMAFGIKRAAELNPDKQMELTIAIHTDEDGSRVAGIYKAAKTIFENDAFINANYPEMKARFQGRRLQLG